MFSILQIGVNKNLQNGVKMLDNRQKVEYITTIRRIKAGWFYEGRTY